MTYLNRGIHVARVAKVFETEGEARGHEGLVALWGQVLNLQIIVTIMSGCLKKSVTANPSEQVSRHKDEASYLLSS